jgi:hypothetical protein
LTHVFLEVDNVSVDQREHSLIPSTQKLQLATFLFEFTFEQWLLIQQAVRACRIRAQTTAPH